MRGERPGPFPAARNAGAYLLLIRLGRDRTLDVGMLGRVRFPAGNYVYTGSGMGGLWARVGRHFRPDKKVKWHIDRLLAMAELSGAVLFPSESREECRLARSVLAFPGARAVPGFGSSDCRCPGHLAHIGALPFGALLGRLDDREPGAGGRVPGRTRRDSVPFIGTRHPAPGTRIRPGTRHPAPGTRSVEASH